VRLEAGSRLRQDVRLALGNASETVQVTGETPALETDSSTLSSVITERQVSELPLNGRNFVQLAQLSAGANEGPAGALSAGKQTGRSSANRFGVRLLPIRHSQQ
jgi:hypothetical protein